MSKRWFTSDTHINHRRVAELRGFLTIEGVPDLAAHNKEVAENWDGVVDDDDLVYVLGDIAMNANEDVFDWFDKRPGRKILIAGNHDGCASFHSGASKEQRKYLEHFESVHDFLQIKINTHKVALSHYPYSGEGSREIEERYTQWRLRDMGLPLLHGHTHGPEREHGYQMHVGLDAWDLHLVPEVVISDWLNTLNFDDDGLVGRFTITMNQGNTTSNPDEVMRRLRGLLR